MPQPTSQLIGCPGIELDYNFVITPTAHHSETPAQMLFHAEFFWLMKCLTWHRSPLYAREGKRPNFTAVNVMPNQVPAIVIAG
jgi:hypothetical protein